MNVITLALLCRCPGDAMDRCWAVIPSAPAAPSSAALARPQGALRRARSLVAGLFGLMPFGQYPGEDDDGDTSDQIPTMRSGGALQPQPIFPAQPAAPGSGPTPGSPLEVAGGSNPQGFSALDNGSSPSVITVNQSPGAHPNCSACARCPMLKRMWEGSCSQ